MQERERCASAAAAVAAAASAAAALLRDLLLSSDRKLKNKITLAEVAGMLK